MYHKLGGTITLEMRRKRTIMLRNFMKELAISKTQIQVFILEFF